MSEWMKERDKSRHGSTENMGWFEIHIWGMQYVDILVYFARRVSFESFRSGMKGNAVSSLGKQRVS